MNNVLAIECATDTCTVALLAKGTIKQLSSSEARSNARVILPMVDELLARAKLTFPSVSALSVTTGPGSFTGIRIGVSLIQGLAYGGQLPVYSWSSLELMAAAYFLANPSVNSGVVKTVVTALDARMNEIYWASYRWDTEKQRLIDVTTPCLSSVEDFASKLQESLVIDDVTGLGSGFNLIPELSEKTDVNATPQAKTMLELLPHYLEIKKPLTTHSELSPMYLRNEITWKKRERIRR